MTGFGTKCPLRKTVVTQDLHYDYASNNVSYLHDLSMISGTSIDQ